MGEAHGEIKRGRLSNRQDLNNEGTGGEDQEAINQSGSWPMAAQEQGQQGGTGVLHTAVWNTNKTCTPQQRPLKAPGAVTIIIQFFIWAGRYFKLCYATN